MKSNGKSDFGLKARLDKTLMNGKSKNESGAEPSKKDISGVNMTNVLKGNPEVLNTALKKTKSPDNKEKAKAFIKLYADWKTSKATTVSN